MEQIRYAQEVAERIACKNHRIHPACEDTQELAPGQTLSMSACTASSDGQPPYMAKGLSLLSQGDSSADTPQPLATRGFKRALHCSGVDSCQRAKMMTTKLFTSNGSSHEVMLQNVRAGARGKIDIFD
eukprot:10528703-Karenia_brevis.AAC.1